MSLKQRLEDDLKSSLLAGNHQLTDTLRGLKAAILNEEVSKGARQDGLEDAAIEQLIAREVKKRQESASIYESAGRPELSKNELDEAKILQTYLPDQLSEEEISKVVDRAIEELNATEPRAMGQVIGAVKQELGNKADGATIAKLVKNALN